MANPSVRIDIATEFTGKKAFDQAGKSTTNLENSVKKLAKTFGVAFGARAVANFAKSSAKAFIEDDNAARSLSVTIKNLGLNFDNNTVLVGRFIDSLEQQTGVLDDELRPAMDRLLRATGDVAKSQELLNLVLDISAGTGKTVTQVSQSLQKAYLGQTAALGRLGVGLTKAELATGKFEDIQQKLTTLFAGQALSAANSYAGQLAKLQVAANNAKETIGEGLIDALKLLGEDTSIDTLNKTLEETSLYIADVLRGIGALGDKIKGIPLLGKAVQLPLDAYVQAIPVIGSYISILSNMGAELRTLNARAGRAYTGGSGTFSVDFVKQREAKLLADRLKAEKAAAAARLAADKKAASDRAKLAKAESIFNLDQIQIEAALKGKISADEKLRLELQRAILNEDFALAEKLQKQLEASQRATAALQGQLASFKPAPNPFAEWIESLKDINDSLYKLLTTRSLLFDLSDTPPSIIAGKQPPIPVVVTSPPNTVPIPVEVPVTTTAPTPTTNMPTPGKGPFYGEELPWYMRSSTAAAAAAPAPTINITVEGSVLSQNDLVKVVNDAVVTANTQGLNTRRPGALIEID
jgi:hypothetical protein